jgi:uncharacterized protein YbcC (UPF0753/DUF2309 family)
MLELLQLPERIEVPDAVREDAARACALIPPLWDLRSFVAVNPFLGFASVPVDAAARSVSEGLGADILPPFAEFARRWRAGEFDDSDLASAARRMGTTDRQLRGILDGSLPPATRWRLPVRTFAEWHDWRHGTSWQRTVVRIVSRWCAVHAADGERAWRLPSGHGLWSRWRAAARHDRTLDVAGLRGFRLGAARLPEDPDAAIAAMLGILGVDATEREQYLYRLLGGMHGWASWFRRTAWVRDRDDVTPVRDLLAILACMDAAVASLAPRSEVATPAVPTSAPIDATEDERLRLAMQDALEDGFARRYLGRIRGAGHEARAIRPMRTADVDAQAVFCIDVRSEVLRRHLESQSGRVQTVGFAGFFGVSLRLVGLGDASAAVGGGRCPVLLKPTLPVKTLEDSGSGIGRAMKAAMSAPGAAFSSVELAGAAFGLRMAAEAAGCTSCGDHHEETVRFALPFRDGGDERAAQRVDVAESILRFTSLGTNLARLVLLCGHAGQSANNPHDAGLQCGACGGHGGALNARVACAILNDASVRTGLARRGMAIPPATHFVAGVHDTSTDEVRILDRERIPASHATDVDRLEAWIAAASEATREERRPRLGIAEQEPGVLMRLLRRRSNDWSQVRPEWALAGNAAFIAARRERTRGVDLGGRSFLHDYDASMDEDGSVLRLILSAPLVVASWINLQYFASTLDNGRLGAGDKLLHNRIGSVGVVLGNGGDLRPGLPLQSVRGEDGRCVHDPLRLQAVIEAPTAKIEEVLETCPHTRDLVDGGWLRLFALDPAGDMLRRCVPGEGWEEFQADAGILSACPAPTR